MTMLKLYDFLSGAVAFGFCICGLFFIRFFHRTRDELFLAFAVAFGLLGVGQAIVTLSNLPTEERAPIFLIRLAAFAVMLFAILRKNRGAKA
jgi:hypothetical protein